MLSITHIAVTLLLIQLLTLDRNDAFVAMLFGVFIDLDHLFGLVNYTQANGVTSIFNFHSLMNPGGQWKSILHAPIAAAVVAPLSSTFRLAIPFLFWGTHLLMDYAANTLGNFSALEGGLLVCATVGLVALRYARYTSERDSHSFSAYLGSELTNVRNMFHLNLRSRSVRERSGI